MARIAGVNIPNHQHAVIALTAIYGIGRMRAQVICAAAGVNAATKMKDLTDAEVEKLREQVAKVSVEGDLRRMAGKFLRVQAWGELRIMRRAEVRPRPR